MTKFADLAEVRLAWETRGDSSALPLVLVRGLGTQMIEWSEVLLDTLADAGHFVILFDNRDVGLSSGFEDAGTDGPAYSLKDMAGDVAGLLDHLAIERAHIAGMSMGGMIAQRFGLAFPERTLSVTSIMSSTGKQDLPPPTEEARYYLTAAPENADDEEEAVELIVKGRLCFDGGAYPTDIEIHRKAVRRAYRRANRPDGVARQMAAIFSDPTRRDELAGLQAPLLVIHGTDDSLLPLGHGMDTANAIPGARMEVVEGMGHALPDSLAPLIADLITSHTRGSA